MEQKTKLQRDYSNLQYHKGFGNHFESEAIKGTLPQFQNSPQKCAHNLVAEQLSGTAFTVSRSLNQRTWLYRLKPSTQHFPFKKAEDPTKYQYVKSDYFNEKNLEITPNQLRWKPLQIPEKPHTFIEGLVSVCGAGDPSIKTGANIMLYTCNTSMINTAFFNSDGDFLIVPQQGQLNIITEMGKMTVKPREICVIQRGIKFAVEVSDPCRGYICEVFKGHFRIPDLGPIGANGLANPRDFESPVAFYENTESTYKLVNKYQSHFFETTQNFSPFNVVAWHGNYVPFKYNLDHFNVMNTVSYDHPDPSIFTVLTCPTDEPGVAVCDFAIFPPRWMVAEHTFRPPYYHRNIMTEYMGNIQGTYDAKETGFQPGGGSLHSMMEAHGPEDEVFHKASDMELKPVKYPYENLAFMFESSYFFKTTEFAMDKVIKLDLDYYKCWQPKKE